MRTFYLIGDDKIHKGETIDKAENATWSENEIPKAPNVIPMWWNGSDWEDMETYPTPQIAVPQGLTPLQFELTLHRAGLLEAVKSAVATDIEYMIYFAKASTFERNNELLVMLAHDVLGLSDEQIDELFVVGGSL